MAKITSIHCQICQSRGKGIFCDLGEEHLKELDSAKTTNCYKRHQIIFYEGNQPYGLFCLSSGKVKIYKADAEGHQQIVRLASAGDVIGYRALLSSDNYEATAETIEDSEICFIDKKTFLHILGSHPSMAPNIITVLAKDLKKAEKQIIDMAHKNIRERLAELFLVFQTRFGKKTEQGIQLDISLTREELAEMIGTTQESVTRLITEFKEDGLIIAEGRRITLIDLKKLTKTANLSE